MKGILKGVFEGKIKGILKGCPLRALGLKGNIKGRVIKGHLREYRAIKGILGHFKEIVEPF